jgi:hypothetical protein
VGTAATDAKPAASAAGTTSGQRCCSRLRRDDDGPADAHAVQARSLSGLQLEDLEDGGPLTGGCHEGQVAVLIIQRRPAAVTPRRSTQLRTSLPSRSRCRGSLAVNGSGPFALLRLTEGCAHRLEPDGHLVVDMLLPRVHTTRTRWTGRGGTRCLGARDMSRPATQTSTNSAAPHQEPWVAGASCFVTPPSGLNAQSVSQRLNNQSAAA